MAGSSDVFPPGPRHKLVAGACYAVVALGLLSSQFLLFLCVDVVSDAAWFGLVSLFICPKNVRMLVLKPRRLLLGFLDSGSLSHYHRQRGPTVHQCLPQSCGFLTHGFRGTLEPWQETKDSFHFDVWEESVLLFPEGIQAQIHELWWSCFLPSIGNISPSILGSKEGRTRCQILCGVDPRDRYSPEGSLTFQGGAWALLGAGGRGEGCWHEGGGHRCSTSMPSDSAEEDACDPPGSSVLRRSGSSLYSGLIQKADKEGIASSS